LPGQECPREPSRIGHTLSMNTKSMIRDTDKYYLYDLVADAVTLRAACGVYAHVNSGIFYVHRDMRHEHPKGKVDFVELLQFNRMDPRIYYEFLRPRYKVTASCGSDVPWGGSVGEVRAYAYLGDQRFSADTWFRGFPPRADLVNTTVDAGVSAWMRPCRGTRLSSRRTVNCA